MIRLWSRRGRIILGAIGIVTAIAPTVGATLLVEQSIRQRAEVVTAEIARDLVARGARTIGSGVSAADDLAADGVTDCSQSALALMRAVTTSVLPVKEAALIDADGNVRCNQYGIADTVEALSPAQPLGDGSTSLRLVRLQSSQHTTSVMVLHTFNGGGVGTFLPGNVIDAGILPPPLRASAVATLRLANGAAIARLEPAGDDQRGKAASEAISTEAISPHLPIAMHLSVPFQTFTASSGALFTYARIGGGLAGGLILAALIYLLKSPPVEIARLAEAQARGEFVPYYQPLIDIGSGRLVGCEVLVRWEKPNGAVVQPASFIELAESSGLAGPMTLSLMRAVRDDLGHAFGIRPQLTISINLFNDHFARLGTVRDIERIFRGASVSFRQLIFELTERQPLSNIHRARVIIRKLQSLGARVALDDAGAGHNGLAHLHYLGVDMVKIDRLFIDTIGSGKTAAPIVDSLIRLGHDLGMEVVAEGVETPEQRDYLRRHGADSAQGYLFSPPLPVRAFLDLVETMEPAVWDQPVRRPAAAEVPLVDAAAAPVT